MKKLLLFYLVLLFSTAAFACTSMLISGKRTPDGRPLLLKNRDTENLRNYVLSMQGEKYRFMGMCADVDKKFGSVWSGHNEMGFAIINTAAYNLNGEGTDHSTDIPSSAHRGIRLYDEGYIMRQALAKCASLQEFEQFLDTVTHVDIDANFGVIDALGNGAYYEVGNTGDMERFTVRYLKFDVNDPAVAPEGYILRTNFGESGNRKEDKGVCRFMAISEYMKNESDFIARKFVTEIPRLLRHGLTHLDIRDFAPADRETPTYFPFRDFIPRYITSCVQLIQGVAPGQDPSLCVAWTIVGHPFTTVALPLVLHPEVTLPRMVTATDEGGSPLNHWGLQLKSQLFTLDRDNSSDYINVAHLWNQAGTGILQQILSLETKLLDKADPILKRMQKKGRVSPKSLQEYYDWVDEEITNAYKEF